MIRAACHCGAVRFTIDPAPEAVLDCNCSICRRYGALWAYSRDFHGDPLIKVDLVQGADDLEAYIWGNRWIGFWRCRRCGCVTHHTALDKPGEIRGINARMFVDFDPARVAVHYSDNSHTGWFWVRPGAEVWEERRGSAASPGPDNWR